MTKLKNTKKGMAKKALSISLVAAMLATSNVPVWAAEDLFTDGSSAAVEAPVVEEPAAEVEAFSAEPAEEANSNVSLQDTGLITNSDIRIENLVMPTSVTYGETIQVSGEVYKNNTELLDNWTAAWRVAGESENFWEENVTKDNWSTQVQLPTSNLNYKQYAGKTLELHFYRADAYAEFDISVGTVTIKAKDVTEESNIDFSLRNQGVYDGKEFTASDLTVRSITVDGEKLEGADITKYFKITAKNAKNAGDEFVIYATAKDKLDDGSANPYSGTISQTFIIKSKPFATSDLVVSYAANTEYEYTGARIEPEISKITVAESKSTEDGDGKLSGADVSSAIIGARAYVNAEGDENVGTKNIDVFVDPTKLSNFDFSNITTEKYEGIDAVKLSLENAYKIVQRDLTKCTVKVGTVPTGFLVSDVKKSGLVKVYDADGNLLKLKDTDYDFIVLETNANGTYTEVSKIENVGTDYKAYVIAPEGSKNTRGETAITSFECAEQTVTASTSKAVSVEYNGKEQEPAASDFGTLTLSVFANNGTAGGVTTTHDFQPGSWEIVDYKDNLDAGTAQAIVRTKAGVYADNEYAITFTITPLQVKAENVVVPSSVVYDRSNKSAADYNLTINAKATSRTGKATEIALTEDDYTATFAFDTKNAIDDKIKTTITVTNPNYIAEGAKREVIKAAKDTTIVGGILEDSFIKLAQTSYVYTGGKITPEFSVVNGDVTLEEGTDYKVDSVDNATDVGTATLIIKGLGKYEGSTAKTTFTITPANVEDITITVTGAKYRGGRQVRPDIANANGGDNGTLKVTLNKNDVTSQFEVSAYGANNTAGEDAGSVTVRLLRGNKNFTGSTKTSTFDIAAYLLEGTIKVYDEHGKELTAADLADLFTYDGTEKTFASVKFIPSGEYASLVDADDYEIKYVNNIYGDTDSKGSVIVVAKDGSNFAGDSKNVIYDYVNETEIKGYAARLDFSIGNLKFDGTNVAVNNGVYAGGLPVKPEVIVQFGGKTLEEGKDYEIEIGNYTDVTSVAKYDIKVIGINGYKGSETSSTASDINKIDKWGIDKQNLNNCDITVKDGTAVVLNGPVRVPDSEYTVTKNDDNTYTVAAKTTSKNYVGSKTVAAAAEEEPVKPGTPMITEVNVVGNKATVVLSGECDGAVGYDYVIATDRDCINTKDYDKVNKNILGTQTTFTYTQQGTYYAYCHAWTRDENGQKVFGEWSNAYPFVVSAITPEQPVITSVKKSGRNLTVTWTQSENAFTGYDIVMGTEMRKVNGEMRPVEYGKAVKKVGPNTFSVTFKSIPKGTYYVGLHAHNRTSETGVKVFSPWSNAKKVTF